MQPWHPQWNIKTIYKVLETNLEKLGPWANISKNQKIYRFLGTLPASKLMAWQWIKQTFTLHKISKRCQNKPWFKKGKFMVTLSLRPKQKGNNYSITKGCKRCKTCRPCNNNMIRFILKIIRECKLSADTMNKWLSRIKGNSNSKSYKCISS